VHRESKGFSAFLDLLDSGELSECVEHENAATSAVQAGHDVVAPELPSDDGSAAYR
jgi:hypothetical protein